MTAGIDFDPAEREAIAASVNNAALRRADPSFKHVIRSASHVALYEFDNQSHVWKRCETEGSLFVVERQVTQKEKGRYRIVITNRKSLHNYSDDLIIGNRNIEAIDQMIMYSNSKGITVGIWFYEKSEAANIYDIICRIVNRQNVTPPSTKRILRRQSQQSEEENSLHRFFPQLKLNDGVTGNIIPDSAKESTELEHQTTDLQQFVANLPSEAPTVFKPTAEIDQAIIHVSETTVPVVTPISNTSTIAVSLKADVQKPQQRSSKSTKSKQPTKRMHGRKPSPNEDKTHQRPSSQSRAGPSNTHTKASSPMKTEPSSSANFETHAPNIIANAIPVAALEKVGEIHSNEMSSHPPTTSSSTTATGSQDKQQDEKTSTMVSQGNPVHIANEQQQLSSQHPQTRANPLSVADYRFPGMPSFAQSAPMNQMAISGPLPPPGPYQSIHPQMAMMLHQQHQMYLQQQQQYIAHLHQQHQMHMQSMPKVDRQMNSSVTQQKVTPPPESQLPMPTTSAKDEESKKLESANHLKRMLNVSHIDITETKTEVVQKKTVTDDMAKNVGNCIAAMDTKKELGVSNNADRDRAFFKAVLQRLLTDKKMFERAFTQYNTSKEL